MRRPVALRAAGLRRIARESEDAGQVRRLLALAVIYDGGSRTQAAEVGGVTLQVVRDWVLRLNAHGPEGLIDRKAPGQPPRLTEGHRVALAQCGERPDRCRAWRGPLADHRPAAMAPGRIPGQRVETDAQPRAASHGLPQAVGPAAPS
jgi:hypothetical protein